MFLHNSAAKRTLFYAVTFEKGEGAVQPILALECLKPLSESLS